MSVNTTVIDIVTRVKDQTSEGMKKAKASVDKLGESIERTRQRTEGLGKKPGVVSLILHDKATAAIEKVKNKMKGLVGTGTLSVIDKATKIISKVSYEIKGIAGKSFQFSLKVIDYATAPLKKILGFATSLKGILSGIILGAAAKKVFADPMMAYNDSLLAQRGFSTSLGSDEKSKEFMGNVEKFGINTPYKTSEVVTFARQMLNSRWEEESVLPDLQRIGDTAAAFGLTNSQTEDVIRGFTQIRSKGTLSAQEMTLQLGEKMPAWSFLAEGLGMDVNDENINKVKKMAENGEIGADEGIRAMMKSMDKYKGQMEWISNNTIPGLTSKMRDMFEVKILKKWGSGLSSAVIPGLQKVSSWLSDNESMLSGWGDTIMDVGKQISEYVVGGIENLSKKLNNIFQSTEFKETDLSGKFVILWDEVIGKPLSNWWSSTGKPWVADISGQIGKGLGEGLSAGIMALLGVDIEATANEGYSIGASFAKGFLDGFNGEKVWDGIKEKFKDMFVSAGKVLPGGETPTTGSLVSGALLGYGGLKLGQGAMKAGKGVKSIWEMIVDLIPKSVGVSPPVDVPPPIGIPKPIEVPKPVDIPRPMGAPKPFGASTPFEIPNPTTMPEVPVPVLGGADVVTSGIKGTAGTLAKGAGKFLKGNWLQLLFAGLSIAQADNKAQETAKQGGGVAGSAVGVGLGGTIGQFIGGAIGTALGGPAGTAIGVGIGRVVGSLGGGMAGYEGGKSVGQVVYNLFKSPETKKAEQEAKEKEDALLKEKEKQLSIEENISDLKNTQVEMKGLNDSIYETEQLRKRWNDVRWELDKGNLSEDQRIAKQKEMNDLVGKLALMYPGIIDASDTENENLGKKLDILQKNYEIEKEIKRLELDKQIIEADKSFDTVYNGYKTSNEKIESQKLEEKEFDDKSENIEQLVLEANNYKSQRKYANETGDKKSSDDLWKKEQDTYAKIRESMEEVGVTDETSYSVSDLSSVKERLYETKQGMIDDQLNELYNNQKLKEELQTKYEAKQYKINLAYGEPLEEAALKYDTMDEKQKEVFTGAIKKVAELKKQFDVIPDEKYTDLIIRFDPEGAWALGLLGGSVPLTTTVNTTTTPRIKSKNASGGLITKAHIGMIGEAGPEAIIPLSGTNKYRGIELWQQVGEMLGTIPKHAQGGIFGLNSSDVNNKFGDALGLAGTTYDRLDDISTVTSKANVYKTFLRPLLGKVPVLGSSSKWMSKTMAKTGGKFGSFTKKLPWVGTALQLGGAAYDVANSDDKEKAIARNVGQITATALGAKALPAIGAILGTLLFPGLGTSVGFAGGAAIAAGLSVAGAFLGNMIGGGLGEGVYNDYKSKKLKEALQGKKRSIADISKSKPTGTPKGSRIRKHATGGIFNDPHIGMIGEAGAEAVIPLSGANKEHGKHLWSETGSILGMNNKVDEGQVQHPQTAPITINLGGMSFTFTGVNTGDNASIIAAVREQMPTIANEMCETIAAALQKVFGNMAPGEVGSV